MIINSSLSTKVALLFAFILTLTSFNLSTHHQSSNSNEDDIIGVYSSPNGKSKIEFVKIDEQYFGQLVWNVNPEIKDLKNSNDSLKGQDLIGQFVFLNLKYNKYVKSWIGEFYDAESGKTYNCELWLRNANQSLLAKGYLGNPLVSKTELLKRIE